MAAKKIKKAPTRTKFNKDVTPATLDEFRATGLLLFVNMFLHIFGWCIFVEVGDDEPSRMGVARTTYRGFQEAHVTAAYEKIGTYMRIFAKEASK